MTTTRMQPPIALWSQQDGSGPPPASQDRRRRPAIDRFLFTYLYRELRSRLRQALLIALGLGVGVGLVVTVSAVSTGVNNAQGAVLHSLYGIGTDLTVTKPASAANSPAGGGPGADTSELYPGALGLLPSTWVAKISRLAHVTSATGGLALSELSESGGVPESIALDGVDVAHPKLGPLAAGTLTAGHDFSTTDSSSNVAILDPNYAAANQLAVGSTVTLEGTSFRVIGITRQTQGGSAADIYIPLARAQALARSEAGTSLAGQVNEIYVTVARSTDVGAVQSEIYRLLPSATVTSESDLANQVSGSLASTAKLTNDLGKWVAAAALLTAFAVAGLLTAAALNRRIREVGTLKALGWTTRRIVTQIMSESAATGIIGAILGIASGFAGTALVNSIAPELSATIPQQNGTGGTTTVAVHLAAHVSPTAVLAAILLAIAGAVIAGATGARRATQLQPADAFAQIG
jgi:putative ABC transport system permease protein